MMISTFELSNIASKQIHKEGYFTLHLLEDRIVEVVWDKSKVEISKTHLLYLKDALKEIGNGKKMCVYVSTFDFMNVSPEGQKFASSPEGEEFTLANAVLIDNLAKKILFNFFMSLYRPNVPVRAFTNKMEAIQWLRNNFIINKN